MWVPFFSIPSKISSMVCYILGIPVHLFSSSQPGSFLFLRFGVILLRTRFLSRPSLRKPSDLRFLFSLLQSSPPPSFSGVLPNRLGRSLDTAFPPILFLAALNFGAQWHSRHFTCYIALDRDATKSITCCHSATLHLFTFSQRVFSSLWTFFCL